MKYLRLFSDEDGESHFEEVIVAMDTVALVPPSPPTRMSPFSTATRYSYVELPSEWKGGPHWPPVRLVTVVLSGAIEYTASDGEVRQVPAGSVISVEDTIGAGHHARVIGGEPMTAVLIELDPR